jgi:hypothetical protein
MKLLSSDMSNWKFIFRILICLFIALEISSFFIPSNSRDILTSISKYELRVIPHDIYNVIFRLYGGIVCFGLGTFLVQIIALVGLWIFWKSARELFVVSYIFSIIFEITTQKVVTHYWWSWPMAIIYSIDVVAIITFSYTRYTKKYFSK